jgi:hypothetical protein
LTIKNEHTLIEHSGGIDGMVANVEMIKDLNYGAVILTNSNSSAAFPLTFKLIGMQMNDTALAQFADRILALQNNYSENEKKKREEKMKPPVLKTQPSLPLSKYAGTYYDEMYGDIYVKLKDTTLTIEFSHTSLFTGKLSPWSSDTFKIDWYDTRVPDGLVTFVLDDKKRITTLTLDQQSLLDVDFTELHIHRK